MPSDRPAHDELPETLVIEHLVGLPFDETIRPSAHERLRADGERARLEALPRIVDDGGRAGEADFTPLEPIGAGGAGVVARGHQRSVGRDVVIKRVRDPSVPGGAAMLMDEGHVMGALEHPSIVPVLALGRDGDGHPALVMKRVDGVTWRALLRDPQHPGWAHVAGDRLEFHLRVLAQVADAAHHAHERGWIHRDIKPDNVMIGPRAEVYLIDWGLALRVPVGDADDAQLAGTPGYIAPEMLLGVGPWLSPRTDVYLLGAALHEVLTGRVRHEGANLRAVLTAAWLSEPAAYPAATPAELASLADAATRVRPEDRPATAAAFKQALEAYLRHRRALALVGEVDALFAGLRATAPDEAVDDEVDLLQRFDGCVAGLRRSLELWPQNADAVGLLSEVLAWRVRRALAQRDVLAAQAALADLPRADPRLSEEASVASARIDLERATQARLSDIGRRHDPRPIASGRARAGGAVAGGALALAILGRFIGLTPGQTLAILPVLAGVAAGLLPDAAGPARWRLVGVCALGAALAPAALRRDPSLLLGVVGLTTLASHLVLASSWARASGAGAPPAARAAGQGKGSSSAPAPWR